MQSLKDILKDIKKEDSNKKDSDKQKELFDTTEFEKKKFPFSKKAKYISKEYQAYGMKLAGKLGDSKRASMYIKWAKEKDRSVLERAYSFTIDYPNAKDKSRIFMWKVKELEKEDKHEKEE
jgi:hypothetical protein